MSGLPAGRGDAFEKLVSTRLCVRFTRGLRKVETKVVKVSFNRIYGSFRGHLRS